MAKKAAKAPAAKNPPKSAKSKPIAKPDKPPSPVAVRVQNRAGPKWNLAKLKMGQFLSMTSYMTVLGFGARDMVNVKNQFGHNMQMSKSLLETMHSGTHFAKEVGMNMTGLAELLQNVQDHIFTVNFKKQATESNAPRRSKPRADCWSQE